MKLTFLTRVEITNGYSNKETIARLYKLEIDGEEYIVNDKGGITPHKPRLHHREDTKKQK